ncbi:MAG: glycosyltransferase family 2 protein [Rhodobacteraceae bacterium]|nr:glycosyltransferase family 2 protein [Paracoccaceae bacterium]
MTLACLRSVVAQTSVPYELIVLDNASSDGSAEAIAAQFPQVTLLAERENHGFAMGNNIAARSARGAFVLLLNPDTVILDHAVDKLLSFAHRTPEARIWGGRTVFGDHSLNPASCWRRMSLWNIFCRTSGLTGVFPNSPIFHSEAYGGWDRGTERHVDIVTGCFFLMRRSDWEEMSGFDPALFMYGEEADLCLRAERILHAAPRVTPDATIIHYGGASEKVRADKMVRLLRAKAELIRRHIPAWQRPLALALFRLWPLSRWVALKLLRKRGESMQVWQQVWTRRGEWENGYT